MANMVNDKLLRKPIPTGVIVLGGYMALQGFFILGSRSIESETSFTVFIILLITGIGFIKASKAAYYAAMVLCSITFISAFVMLIAQGTDTRNIGYLMGIVFWAAVLIASMLLPGIRNYFFSNEVGSNEISEGNMPRHLTQHTLNNYTPTIPIIENGNAIISELTWKTGARYYGKVVNGKRHGWGAMHYPSGLKHIGEYSNDIMHGKGTMFYPDGRRQEGVWENGKIVK